MEKRTKVVEVEEYVAVNGRAFKTEQECLDYEDKLNAQVDCVMWSDGKLLPTNDYSIHSATAVLIKSAAGLRWFNNRSERMSYAAISLIPEAVTYPIMFRFNDWNYSNWEDEKAERLAEIEVIDKMFESGLNLERTIDSTVEPDYNGEE